ncbi:substrate-binding periplasmic protein [Algicola sagamiensis]|uniref:substrate-binding periplasmic protein n=1 Tax=Algicola sagamiensis TaxID=163869 RepID=UPI000373573B|nr:transporter substrate-binding domain-containing protein [Algicola sagamiensis]
MTASRLITFLLGITCISLCAEEKKHVDLTTINWEPYTGETLNDGGFFTHIVTQAFQKAGYQVTYHYRPWTRALKEAKDGEVHGVMDVYKTKERTKFLSYPDVVWKVKEELITVKPLNINYGGDLSNLKSAVIGVIRGSTAHDDFDQAQLKTYPYNQQDQGILLILKERIDLILAPRSLFFYHLERLSPRFDRSKVKILSPPYKVFDMYVAFSKKKPGFEKLTEEFNAGLKQIKADGSYQKILKKHFISVDKY